MEKLQGSLEDIHGDVHALMNVVRSQHHQSRTTISVLVARLGKGMRGGGVEGLNPLVIQSLETHCEYERLGHLALSINILFWNLDLEPKRGYMGHPKRLQSM